MLKTLKWLSICLLWTFCQISDAQSLIHKPGELLLKANAGVNLSQIMEAFGTFKGRATQLNPVQLISPQLNIWKWTFDPQSVDEDQLLSVMRRSPLIDLVQFNHLLKLRNTPDDPLLSSQWQWINDGSDGGIADADVDADEAWDITTGGLTASGDTIVVAVIDDGTDLDHEDLIDNIWVNHFEIPGNKIDDDNNGYIDDVFGWNSFSQDGNVDNGGHGVAVSGMIGAKGNNGKGVTGINWNVKIMMIVGGSGEESEVIMSYSYALKQRQDYNQSNGAKGAFVVATNSSWGIDGGQPDDAPLWCAFYDTLGVNGILSVGATANNAVDIDVEGDLPTGCSSEYLLSVTATNNADQRTFSAWGLETIDVAAPGGNIFTTEPGGYGNTSGTSFASPLTAGLIALLYSAPCSNLAILAKTDPSEAAKQVRDYIFQGVDKTDQLTKEIKYGGRVNARTSIDLLMAACGPCPAPNSIKIFGVTDKVASFLFTTINTDAIVEVRYRIQGDPDWIVINDASSPLKLQNLSSCSVYEYSFRSVCPPSDSSDWLPAKTFKTDGCCENPFNFNISFFDESSVVLAWDNVLIAQGYQVQFKEKLEGDWQIFDTQNTNLEITGLLPCTQYLFSVRTICGANDLPWSDTLTFKTVGCGACTDFVYCEATGNSNIEWLESFEFGDIINISGNDGGYGDYTDGESTILTPGLTYSVTLSPGYNGFDFNENFFVYIDWNQNGIFDLPEELVYESEAPTNVPSTGTITVPVDAFPGYTRLRAMMRFSNIPDDPCSIFDFGEIEDYCVLIKDPACKLTPEILVSDITFTTAKFTWSKVEDAIVYTFRYRKASGGDWTEIADTAANHTLVSLDICTPYEFQVQTVCLEDTSGYSASILFQTQCVTGTNDPNAGVDKFFAYPNPFSEHIQLDMIIAQADEYNLDVFSLNGILESHQEVGQLLPGNQSINLRDAGKLPTGVHFIRMSSSSGNAFIKVIKQ